MKKINLLAVCIVCLYGANGVASDGLQFHMDPFETEVDYGFGFEATTKSQTKTNVPNMNWEHTPTKVEQPATPIGNSKSKKTLLDIGVRATDETPVDLNEGNTPPPAGEMDFNDLMFGGYASPEGDDEEEQGGETDPSTESSTVERSELATSNPLDITGTSFHPIEIDDEYSGGPRTFFENVRNSQGESGSNAFGYKPSTKRKSSLSTSEDL